MGCGTYHKNDDYFEKHFRCVHLPFLIGVSDTDIAVMLGKKNKYTSGSDVDPVSCRVVIEYAGIEPPASPLPSPPVKRSKEELKKAIDVLAECATGFFDQPNSDVVKQELEAFKRQMRTILQTASRLCDENSATATAAVSNNTTI